MSFNNIADYKQLTIDDVVTLERDVGPAGIDAYEFVSFLRIFKILTLAYHH